MKLFVIFATVVAYTCASPAPELRHPSPVNPDVLVAIKPDEKIIMITDPKEIAKFKRETRQPFYPTVLPKAIEHRITKREHSKNEKTFDIQESHKRDIPVPLVSKYHHQEETSKESRGIESGAERNTEKLEHDQVNKFSKQQQYKRDIPVPLVAKYHHPEESPKDNNKEKNHDETVEHKQEQISKEQQQNSQASSNTTTEILKQQEQSTPMPQIDSKLESPKDDDNLQDKKKDVKAENSDSSQSHNQQSQLLPTDKPAATQEKLHNHHSPLNLKANQYHSVQTSPDQNQTISIWYRDLHIDKKAQTDDHNPAIRNVNNENVALPKHSPTHIFNEVSKQNVEKPKSQDDNLGASDSTKSSTEHHLARPHPVPVAELFANHNR